MVAFKLTLDPDLAIHFSGPFTAPSTVTLKLTNTDDAPCAYKVKCTSNAFFKIRPPVGVLDKTGNVNVTITFTLGDAMMPVDNFHFISIYYLDGVEASKTGREAWKDQEPTGSKRLQVTFDRPADEANQDEKEDKKDEKEEDKKEDKEDETTDDKKEEKKEADEEEPSGATQ